MAAVEADVLGMGTAGRGDNGVMVTTSQGARNLAADGSGNAQGGGNAVNNLLKQPLARKILPWATIVLVVLLGVIAVMQLYDLVASIDGRRSPAALARRIRATWQAIITPFLAFAIATTLFQLLLPTALLPGNGNSASFIDNRLSEFPGTLTDQLGLGEHPLVGIAVLGLAAAGAVIASFPKNGEGMPPLVNF